MRFWLVGLIASAIASGAATKPAPPVELWRLDCGTIDIDDLAVFQRPDHGSPFKLIELAPGVTAEDVLARTSANYVE